jgi:hypothetical protein
MKGFLLLVMLTLLPVHLAGQTRKSGFPETSSPDSGWYTVRGERHGKSFFEKVRYDSVEYEAGEKLSFKNYHTVRTMYDWLYRWEKAFPNLIRVEEVARSYEGRPILQAILTNTRTGPDTNKPAAFFEGGRHSGEITSSESVLWLIRHLVTEYGRDKRITRLLDNSALYLRPENNPDGSNLYLYTAQSNRSTVRPHDSDRDGLLDEDPPEDLDGDGAIYRIRWLAGPDDADKANYVLDPRDPTGQLMKRVPEGTGRWRMISEGIDNDGDGKFNEDGIGGMDLHRNYPENWRPDRGEDLTGRGFTQFGAGPYPMSEPETRSVVLWLLSHPNISVVNSMDTRVPMHLRPPSTSFSRERMYPEDLACYQTMDSLGLRFTGYPWAGDVYDTYMTRIPVNPVTGDSARPSPLFGHGPDFGYFYYGAIWYGDELWNGGRFEDVNRDGLLDDVDALAWDIRENDGKGFREWEPMNHPQLGRVEIGGFHPKFFSQNPPPGHLEKWIRNQALFNLEMALRLPCLDWESLKITAVDTGPDSATYRIRVQWTNRGRLPTALMQARLVKIVRQDRVRLEFEKDLLKEPNPGVRIIDPPTFDKIRYTGWTAPGERGEAVFTVRIYGLSGVRGKVQVLSTRGGFLEKELILGHPEKQED